MKNWISGALFALAIVVTVASVRASRWIFLNELDLLTRRAVDNSSTPFPIDELEPLWAFSPDTYKERTASQELTRALLLHSEDRRLSLENYTSAHPSDVLGWAVAARMSCMVGAHFPDDPNWNRATAESQLQYKESGVNACEKGEELDPENGFFPLLEASLDGQMGQAQKMEQALARVGRAVTYSTYMQEQEKAMEQAIVEAKGYRGELVSMGVDCSILLPEYAHVKALAKYLNRQGSLQEKVEMLHAIRLMGLNDPTAIGILVSAASAKILVNPNPMPINGSQTVSDEQWATWSREFDQSARSSGLEPLGWTAEQLQREDTALIKAASALEAQGNVVTDMMPNFGGTNPAEDRQVAWILIDLFATAALLLSIAYCGIFSLLSLLSAEGRLGIVERAKPVLVAVLIALTATIFCASLKVESAPVGPVVLACSLVLAVGYGVVRIPNWSNFSDLQQRAAKWGVGFATWVLYLLAGVATAGFGFDTRFGTGCAIGCGLGLVAVLLVSRKDRETTLRFGGVGLIVLSLLYLVAVGRQVGDNRAELKAHQNYVNEGPRVREAAGVP